ncbi:dienelactone hydrolase family protein [Longimicrobium terrae]|uniref:Pimeloyl-ACP methyl ester carboxylesterase n=1 Tax=Longimicrobium terrae TaxID=1639882 RepID=A0A841H032_9BACT|nr:hypothetical protein [Longimicrobium terrae]MBB4637012.1 pimeloyl-ACP methyl ester carboxylesterase [Longimicrobium terrae]MBB6071380.1 pimeloyl-ACP methyl ester carboxylesterase [Longimicrobium terrae]NNC31403.1 hypothetical protein [Longimicrobium terrae]
MIPTARTARFLRTYMRGGAAPLREEELRIDVGGQEREATLYLPRTRRAVPGWVVLHGLTVPGRRHRALEVFVRSLAASGAAVLVPDVPAWRALRLDVDAARQTLLSASAVLMARPEVRPGGVGAVGFSFGATHALMATADPAVRAAVRAVVAFGGYADIEKGVHTLLTGEHEWAGVRHVIDPDPYGRWIMVGNYLTAVPEFAAMEGVARGALSLAVEAGHRGKGSWEADYDGMKAEIRAGLSAAEREVWDVVAPPAGTPMPDREAARALAARFAPAVLRANPGLDARVVLPRLGGRIVLSHGRADRLVPYTETLRIQSLLPAEADVSVAITGLFAHSAHAGAMHPFTRAREAGVFIRLLNQALGSV